MSKAAIFQPSVSTPAIATAVCARSATGVLQRTAGGAIKRAARVSDTAASSAIEPVGREGAVKDEAVHVAIAGVR